MCQPNGSSYRSWFTLHFPTWADSGAFDDAAMSSRQTGASESCDFRPGVHGEPCATPATYKCVQCKLTLGSVSAQHRSLMKACGIPSQVRDSSEWPCSGRSNCHTHRHPLTPCSPGPPQPETAGVNLDGRGPGTQKRIPPMCVGPCVGTCIE